MVSKYELFAASVACMYHDIQKIQRLEMAKYGMKGPQAQCLLALARAPGGLTAAELCRICERDKAAVSRVLGELERSGMLTRRPQGGTRYRAKLSLTQQGQAAAAMVGHRARLAVEQAGEGLDDAEREVFYRVLARIAENLHTICHDGIREDGGPTRDQEKP